MAGVPFVLSKVQKERLHRQRITPLKMERYRWEFCGHILVSLHTSLLHISFISLSSWTLSALSGKRCLHLFKGDSGRETKLGALFRQFKCLSSEPDAFFPSFHSCSTHCLSYNLSWYLSSQEWQRIRCWWHVPDCGRPTLSILTASGSATSRFSWGASHRWALLYRHPSHFCGAS